MKVTIGDSAALRRLSPVELTAFLRSIGWQPIEATDSGSRWAPPAGTPAPSLLIPRSTSFADYAVRVAEVLRVLSDASGRSQLDVFHDVDAATKDTLRLAIEGADFADGGAPVRVGSAMAVGAMHLVQYGGCAAIEPRPRYGPRVHSDVRRLLDQVRLTRIEQGSFVIALQVSVPPRLGNEGQRDPFQRRSLTTLMQGLRASLAAASRAVSANDATPFLEAVDSGVSANLLETVARLLSFGEAIRVETSWAPCLGAPGQGDTRVRFEPEYGDVFASAAQWLREQPHFPGLQVQGKVVKLVRQPGSLDGQITLRPSEIFPMRTLRVDLLGPDYSVAVDAHRRGSTIELRGDWVIEGRRNWLRNPGPVTVIEPPPDAEER